MSVKDNFSSNVAADSATDKMKKMSLTDDFTVIRGVTGKVSWFSSYEGYGFITRDDNEKDIFVHYSNIVRSGRSLRALSEGDQVEFDVTQGIKGLKASTVTAPGGKLIKGNYYIRALGFRQNQRSGFRKNRNGEESVRQKELDNNNAGAKTNSDSVENVKKTRNNNRRKHGSRKAGGNGEKDDRKTSKSASVETVAESGDCPKKEAAGAVQTAQISDA